MSACVQNVTKYWVSSVTQLWHFCSILIFTERQGGDSEDKVMTSLMDPELPIARSIPNSRHEQRSASCSCPSRESCSNGALFSFSAAAGKLFLHRTEPCWNGDQLKSCWAKKKIDRFCATTEVARCSVMSCEFFWGEGKSWNNRKHHEWKGGVMHQFPTYYSETSRKTAMQ